MDFSRVKPSWKYFFFGVAFYFVAKYLLFVLFSIIATIIPGSGLLSSVLSNCLAILDFPIYLVSILASFFIPLSEHPVLDPILIHAFTLFYFVDWIIWGLVFLLVRYLYLRSKK